MKINNLIYAILLSACLSTSAKTSMADRIKNAKQPSNTVKIDTRDFENKVEEVKKTADKTSSVEAEPIKASMPKEAPTQEPKRYVSAGPVEDKKETSAKLDEPKKEETKLQLNFENASLQSVLDDIGDLFDLVFIPDEVIHTDAVGGAKGAPKPMGHPGFGQSKSKSLADTKVTFRTHEELTKERTLALLDLFLEIADLARAPIMGMPSNYFRITETKVANKAYLPTFIGVEPEALPDTGLIRYLYFLSKAEVTSIVNTVKELKSASAEIGLFQDTNAIILTDQAYNIKSLMKIIKEIDSNGFPEILTVVKLRNSDASEAVALFKSLQGEKSGASASPYMRGASASGASKSESSYFSPNTKIIADNRTNSLIIMGKKDATERAERFIADYIDKSLTTPPDLLHVVELNWVTAKQMADILNNIVKYGKSTGGQGKGGQGEKFFSNLIFEAEPQGNRLIVRGKKEDFDLILPIIKDLDQKQPQVAIEVLIVNLSLSKNKSLGARMRTPSEDPKKFNFQTSPGFGQQPIQINTDNNSLVANLVNLATSTVNGSSILTLGKTSVWAIMSILKKNANTSIISNPFLVATNKYPATVSLGSTRRITTGTISGISSGNTQGDAEANLSVTVTPQINAANNINLKIDVTIEDFTSSDTSNGNKSGKKVITNANVADGEVLAFGGIIRNKVTKVKTGVPVLSKLPGIGSLFKYRSDQTEKENLVIFMAPKIIRNDSQSADYTKIKSDMVKTPMIASSCEITSDPIQRYFFGQEEDTAKEMLKKISYKSGRV